MRAAVLNRVPGPLEIEEIQIDDPGPREVLVRVVASGLCHSDLHFMEGKYVRETPLVLGHEASGVVEAVGRDVVAFRPGDHVVACLSVFCGHCPDCLSGRPALCEAPERERAPGQPPRLSRNGTPVRQFAHLSAFAEQMLVHEHALVKIRPDMPLDRAALIGCAVTTGVGAVINTAKVPPGGTVAVLGCGGIGLNCIQGAALAGAGRIIAVDTLAWKLELARSFGATDLVDAAEEDTVAVVRELTGGGVEYSFEAIGLKRTAEQAFAMLRAGGHRYADRIDSGGANDRAAGDGFPRREAHPGLVDGLQPLPDRHPPLRRLLPRRKAQTRRADLGPDRSRRRRRRLRGTQARRGRAERHRVRLGAGGVRSPGRHGQDRVRSS